MKLRVAALCYCLLFCDLLPHAHQSPQNDPRAGPELIYPQTQNEK